MCIQRRSVIMALVRVRRPELAQEEKNSKGRLKYKKQKDRLQSKLLRAKWKEEKKTRRAKDKAIKTAAKELAKNPEAALKKSSIIDVLIPHPHAVATIINAFRRRLESADQQTSRTTTPEILRVYGYHTVFTTPAQIIVSGPTKTGKTTLVTQILQHKDSMFDREFDEITYYSANGNAMKDAKSQLPSVRFREGQPDWSALSRADPSVRRLVVLDDMQNILKGPSQVKLERLFTVDSHHNNISVIFIVHDNFQPKMVTIRRNADYMLCMTGGNVAQQIKTTASQMGLGMDVIKEAVEDVTKDHRYGYLLLTVNNSIEGWRRVASNIFPGQQNTFYIPAGTREEPSLVTAKEVAREQQENGIRASHQNSAESERDETEKMSTGSTAETTQAPVSESGSQTKTVLAESGPRTSHSKTRKTVAKRKNGHVPGRV